MLVALLTAFLLVSGGGGIDLFTKDDQKLVEEVIVEEERAEGILRQMEYAERTANEQLAHINDLIKEWQKAGRDYETGPEDLQSTMAGAQEAGTHAQTSFVDALIALKDEMSREEWGAVFGDKK